MDIKKVKQVLLEAESSCWLAGEEGEIWRTTSMSPGQTRYQKYAGSYFYIDEYHGNLNFVGMETITLDDQNIWGRSYYGITSPTSDYTKEMILDSVRKGRARFISDLWNGAAELQCLLPDNLIFVIGFPNPDNVSFERFLYHEWISDDTEESKKEVLFHRICAGGIIK
ncbi:MAG: DUF5680 domain-containing protein [Candidatus Doudnabacteria bacterium]